MPTPASSTFTPGRNAYLAEQLNDEMRASVMPVTVFVGVETVFGFFGNMLILYVFLLHYHKCNFKYFVLCLAFVDFTSTLTTMPGEIVTQIFWYVYPVPIVCKIKSFFNVFTVCGSAFTLLVIAIDRFRKICRPLEWQITPKMALVLCFVQLAVAFVLALPVAFLWGVQFNTVTYNNQTINVTNCEKDEEFRYTDYPIVYTVVTETIMAISMMVMFVLYIFVCRKLLSNRTKPGHGSRPTAYDNNKLESEARLSGGVTSDEDNPAQIHEDARSARPNADTLKQIQMEFKTEQNKQIVYPSLTMNKTPSQSTFLADTPNTTQSSEKPKGKKHAKRIRRKTLIMFILTAVFIVTTILYLTLLSFIAKDILQNLTNAQKAVYFFFFRLYFINHVINPILYGILDQQFLQILKQVCKSAISTCISPCSGQK